MQRHPMLTGQTRPCDRSGYRPAQIGWNRLQCTFDSATGAASSNQSAVFCVLHVAYSEGRLTHHKCLNTKGT